MPTGSAEVWRLTASSELLSRPWFADDLEIDLVGYRLATLPAHARALLGTLDLSSGWLVVLWSAEDGAELINVEPVEGRVLDLSVRHAGMIAALPVGRYACYHDEVTDGQSKSDVV